jgi:hypothetical protein
MLSRHATRLALVFLGFLIPGCVHIEIFHPDVEGTYHVGPDRPFWTYEGRIEHVEVSAITPVAQETPTWCWAAASQMLLQSQGVELSQTEIVRRAYGDVRESGGKSPLMVQALTGTFRKSPNHGGGSLTLEAHRADGLPHNGLELLASIEEGRPFIVDIGYYKDGKIRRGEAFAAHSVLVYGLTYRREGNVVQILSLDTLDPSYAMIQQTEPSYSAHQRIESSAFEAIQGTLGIYRR